MTELYTNYSELLTTVTPQNIHQELKWKTILSCWDEYRVCSLCATFGEDPTENYESILKNTLHSFEENVAQAKIDRSDWGILLTRVYSEISSLLKYSSYYLGTCIGFEIDEQNYDLDFFSNISDILVDIALKYKVFAQEKGDDVWVQLLS